MPLPQQAVILAGGRAQRLGSLAHAMPKPLLPVGGRPFVEYLLDEFARFGFSDILLACGRLGKQISDRYDGCEWKGAHVFCASETQEGGTAGALRQLWDRLEDTFALANGDTLFDLDWLKLAGGLRPSDAGIVALRSVPASEAARYGEVRLEEQSGSITHFADRPKSTASSGEALINGGGYVLRRDALASVAKMPSSLERDVLPHLARANKLRGAVFSGEFIDMGVPEDYARAQTLVKQIARREVTVCYGRNGNFPSTPMARKLAARGAWFLWTSQQDLPEAHRKRSALRSHSGIRLDGVFAARSFPDANRHLQETWPLLAPARAADELGFACSS